jgi:dienelactone hydrolase
MRTLIVTDIFGCNESLQSFCGQLTDELHIVSPYDFHTNNDTFHEQVMYQHFIDNLGHDAYADKVQEALINIRPDFIVAFSAGATAAWRALARTPLKRVQKMIAFYPGQIRNFTELNPNCHVDIYFPEVEEHFDLNSVISALKTIPSLYVVKSRYKHGFMNASSNNFDLDAYRHYSNLCLIEQKNLCTITDKQQVSLQVSNIFQNLQVDH